MQYQSHSVECRESELPGCCGVNVLYNMRAEGGPAAIRDAINDLIAKGGGSPEVFDGRLNAGLLMYTTTEKQSAIAEGLAAAGFSALIAFKNPRSGSQITVWGLAINQDFKKPKKSVPALLRGRHENARRADGRRAARRRK